MNKVSWRRILQRAGHEFPNEEAAVATRDALQIRDGRNGSNASTAPKPSTAPRKPEPGLLESELKRALDRAAQREHEAKAAVTPPGWEPIFMARELNPAPRGAAMLREVPRKAPLPAVKIEAPDEKRSGSGTRNILALSLSVAVVGFALQQIGTQWNQSRGGGAVRAIPEAGDEASALQAGAAVDETQLAYGVRPAAQEPRGDSGRDRQDKGREVFIQEIEQAASVLAAPPNPRPQARQASVTPASVPSVKQPAPRDLDADAISGAEEQSMLRRARELMQLGHVTGARLIFEHLALRQSALGAFALAQTYDEKFLKGLSVQGLAPDQKMAAKWYRRAAELGSQSAPKN